MNILQDIQQLINQIKQSNIEFNQDINKLIEMKISAIKIALTNISEKDVNEEHLNSVTGPINIRIYKKNFVPILRTLKEVCNSCPRIAEYMSLDPIKKKYCWIHSQDL